MPFSRLRAAQATWRRRSKAMIGTWIGTVREGGPSQPSAGGSGQADAPVYRPRYKVGFCAETPSIDGSRGGDDTDDTRESGRITAKKDRYG